MACKGWNELEKQRQIKPSPNCYRFFSLGGRLIRSYPFRSEILLYFSWLLQIDFGIRICIYNLFEISPRLHYLKLLIHTFP